MVADLTARGYLDDEAFARHWVAIRAARGYGPARLRAELRARGIAAPLVAAALAGGDDDSELERARAAARLRDHLLRRGFAASMVARVVRECVGLAVED